jgi:hypothetical protein
MGARRCAAAAALALALMAVAATAQEGLPNPAEAAPTLPAATPTPTPLPKQAAPVVAPQPQEEEPLFETAEGVPNRPVGPPPPDTMPLADREVALGELGPRCEIEPGMYGCTVEGRLLPNTTTAFTLTLPENSAANLKQGGYRLLATLRTMNGMAEMTIASVSRGTPASFDAPAVTAYTTPGATEMFAQLPASITRQNAGQDIFIGVGMASRPVEYTLRVAMPFASVTLDKKEMQAVRDLNEKCCGQAALDRARDGKAGVSAGDLETADGRRTRTMCAKELPAAAADDHPPEDDLCNMPPNICDADGRLLTLSLPNAGLFCEGGLPESLGKLGRLEVLDLAFNDLDGQDIADVAKVRGREKEREGVGWLFREEGERERGERAPARQTRARKTNDTTKTNALIFPLSLSLSPPTNKTKPNKTKPLKQKRSPTTCPTSSASSSASPTSRATARASPARYCAMAAAPTAARASRCSPLPATTWAAASPSAW